MLTPAARGEALAGAEAVRASHLEPCGTRAALCSLGPRGLRAPSSHVEALSTPHVTVFGGGLITEAIRVKRGHKGGDMIQ